MIYKCPHCSEEIDVAEIAQGKPAVCPKCGGEISASDSHVELQKETENSSVKIILLVVFIALFSLIFIPHYFRLRAQANMASAKNTLRKTRLANEVWF